jgi:hypothetical protein
MQLELPLAALLIARLPDASMQMLAFGSLAYPLAVVAESPSYMLTSLGTVKGMHGGAFGRMLRFSVMVAMLLAGASAASRHARAGGADMPRTVGRPRVVLRAACRDRIDRHHLGDAGDHWRVAIGPSAREPGVWPVVYGFVKLLVCAAQAYLPIVERSSHAPSELQRQKRFAWWMLPLPLIGFATAYAQARLIRVNRPGALTEGILVATIALFAVICIGVMTASWTGAQVGAMAMLLGAAAEYVWLLLRVRTACTHVWSSR